MTKVKKTSKTPDLSLVSMRIYVKKDGKTSKCLSTNKKAKVLYFIRTTNLKEGELFELLVQYYRGVDNSGEFSTKTMITQALKEWTESMQLEYIYGRSNKW